MAEICPAILAETQAEYHNQMEKIAHFVKRIQIDLTDGDFAKHRTVTPEQAWWPVGVNADFHLMYRHPGHAVKTIMQHKPSMIIVHAEAEGDFGIFADFCHRHEVKVGIALLQQTNPETILPALHDVDHVLIFSGDLGNYGGQADLELLDKVNFLKDHKPELEIGWDGGINDQNISQLAYAGVDVFNVGGFIQKADDPARTYHSLQRIVDETGTT